MPAPGCMDRAPAVANPIADQAATEAGAWSFPFAANTFSDPDADALAYTATLGDGSALPGWLSFNAATRTFSGTPPQGTVPIALKVTASDGAVTVSDTFTLNIDHTPVVANAIANQTALEAHAYGFTFA